MYNFYCKYECNYNGRMLYYGGFSGDKPCWHADIGDDVVEELVKVDENAPREKVVYRLSGKKGATIRFTYAKISRLAVDAKEDVIKKRNFNHIPA